MEAVPANSGWTNDPADGSAKGPVGGPSGDPAGDPALEPDTALAATGTLRRATLVTLLLLAVTIFGALLIVPTGQSPGLLFLTNLFARSEDIPVALGMAALLIACGLVRPAGPHASMLDPAVPPRRWPEPGLSKGAAWAMLAGLVLVTWLIRTRFLFDHDFTRDEQMVSFDAAIYATGHLFARIPEALRPLYTPLNALFLFPVSDHSAWVSNYLPVNAAIRALAGKVIAPSLVSPLLTGMAGLLLWRMARHLWPGERQVHLVVLLCFVGSAQVVLTGTATFAMSMHLALNLLWLACFLKGTRAGHAGAMITGLFATGIHQPLFHPLFVLPFLDLLRRRGEWRTLACYIAAYAAIGLFWLAWPHGVLALIAPAPGPGALAAAGQIGLIDRLVALLGQPSPNTAWVMAANVLRFVTWQHVLLVPLALVGLRKCAAEDDLVRALAWGVALPLVVIGVLLPVQGHGWGYRYLHGVIGNCCLLAGYGWHWLAARRAAPVRAMVVASAASLLVLLPLRSWMARTAIAPFAHAASAAARTPADFLVFESQRVPFATNFVINRPDLSNRPLLLLSEALTPAGMAALCPGHSVAFADASAFNDVSRLYEDPPRTGPGAHQQALREAARKAGCGIVPFRRQP